MIKILKNTSKAAIAIAVTPLSLIADVLTMPASAYRGDEHPFKRTTKLLNIAGNLINESVQGE